MTMPRRIPVVSGGFDPMHSGHVELLKAAYEMYMRPVLVLLNSDEWLTRKKGKAFMPFEERKSVLGMSRYVAEVFAFDDSDDSCIQGLEMLKNRFPKDMLVFCNGGDRTKENIPEMEVQGIRFEFSVGGSHKKNSSSWILRDAIAQHKEDRIWGSFVDLYQTKGAKVKELTIKPGKGISYQRHFHRSEVWYVLRGTGKIWRNVNTDTPWIYEERPLNKDQVSLIPKGYWHKLWNESDEDLVIIEIQYGDRTSEDDIERILDLSQLDEMRKNYHGFDYN